MDNKDTENCDKVVQEYDVQVKVEKNKRILHFSDGTMEEESSEDECDNCTKNASEDTVDESQMTWTPWILHKISQTGNRLLTGGEYVGGSISKFLGISTPKYEYELEQFRKMQEEQAKWAKEDKESASWLGTTNTGNQTTETGQNVITEQEQVQKCYVEY